MTTLDNHRPRLVRVQEKGQVTLPADVRKQTGLKKGDFVSVTATDAGVLITPVAVTGVTGSAWLKALHDYFAPVREEAVAKGYTEGEIDAAIDQAVVAVRARPQ